jgi:eukaryotic-like serine/threonine-protein kinase
VDAPQTLGKYDILELLGTGGMGTVYRARDRVLERIVAVKLLHRAQHPSQGSTDHGARFLNEARAVARLNHPNIVSLFEFSDEDPAGAFFAMEYVEGRSVADYMFEDTDVRLGYAVPLMGQLLDGLHYAHANGVIHRDIKPANLLVTEKHRLKISDFGIAKFRSASQTSTGLMVGTPAYMAPEQYRGDEIDQRCDVYSAAVVFYELLTGQRPFSGELAEMLYQICHRTPRPASSVEPAVPPQFDSVLAKGLDKDPQARYQTAGEFAAAITAVSEALAGTPLLGTRGAIPVGVESPAHSPVRGVATSPTALMSKRVRRDVLSSTPESASQRTGPPPGWTCEELTEIEGHLAPIFGPLARIVVKRAALLTQDRAHLCNSLAGSLRSDEERQWFLNQVQGTSRVDAPSVPKAVAAIGVITPETQGRTATVLTRYLGPIAPILVKKAAQFAADEPDFYRRVTERIADVWERANCMAELAGPK